MGLAVDGAILVVVAFWVLTSLEVQISCSLLAFLTSSFRFYLAVMPWTTACGNLRRCALSLFGRSLLLDPSSAFSGTPRPSWPCVGCIGGCVGGGHDGSGHPKAGRSCHRSWWGSCTSSGKNFSHCSKSSILVVRFSSDSANSTKFNQNNKHRLSYRKHLNITLKNVWKQGPHNSTAIVASLKDGKVFN